MRVHGDKTLRRSTEVEYQTEYENYRPDLRNDFKKICGYCGKHEFITCKGFEIDHFVPDNVDSSRKCDYSNLVYSCFTCNRKKLGKWPTCNKDSPNDGINGFIDPASDEFDSHLGRKTTGEIEPLSPVGQYMYLTAFRFNIRPIKEIWKAMQLFELKDKLFEIKDKLTQQELLEYLEIDQQFKVLKEYLFDCKE